MKTMLEYAILGYLFSKYHGRMGKQTETDARIIETAATITFGRLIMWFYSPLGTVDSAPLSAPYKVLVLDAVDAFREQAKAFFILTAAIEEESE